MFIENHLFLQFLEFLKLGLCCNFCLDTGTQPNSKNRYAMRTCVCYLEIIVGYVVLSYTVQNVGFVGFVWCHVCFAALKINETVGKKN